MDFTQACILIAAVLAALSIPRYRLIALVIFFNFVIGYLTAIKVLEILDGAKAWPLHALYIIISGLTIITLLKLGGSMLLNSALFAFSLYNLAIIFEFIGSGVGFHANYVVVARVQMVVELLFLLSMSKVVLYGWNRFKPTNSYSYFLDRLFASRFSLHGGATA